MRTKKITCSKCGKRAPRYKRNSLFCRECTRKLQKDYFDRAASREHRMYFRIPADLWQKVCYASVGFKSTAEWLRHLIREAIGSD